MNENKICPLLSVSQDRSCAPLPEGVGVGWAYCQEESCAWYAPPLCAPNGKIIKDGRCAVQYLGALPDLVQKVGQL